MSELLTKEKINHILADLEAEDELYERQKALEAGEEIKGRKVGAAEYVLTRSAGAQPDDFALIAEPQDLSWAKEDNIERDGCQFIDAIYLFLDELGCPPDARDFVLVIAGISAGNYSDMLPITDDQIARRMGYERHALRRKRKALIEWEQKNDWSVLEIHEKEFNREKMKYKPTEYRVTVTPFAAKFIREYRRLTSFKANRKALEGSVVVATKQIAERIAEDLPNAPIVRRQQKKAESRFGGNRAPSLPMKTQTRQDEDAELINHFDRWCGSQVHQGHDLMQKLERMQWKFHEAAQKHLAAQNGKKTA